MTFKYMYIVHMFKFIKCSDESVLNSKCTGNS